MKVGIRVKIISLVLVPAVMIALGAVVAGVYKVSDVMSQKMMNQLKVSAYAGREFYESMNDGEFSRNEDGTVMKGDVVITGSFDFVDTVRESGQIFATFFYNDERIVTNVLDGQGQRMIGTKASAEVVKAVLTEGHEYSSKSVIIGDEEYYGFYVPVRQSGSDEVIGMFFTGDRKGQIDEEALAASLLVVGIVLAIMIPCIIAAIVVAVRMSRSLMRTVESLNELARGELTAEIAAIDISRNDEIGHIASSSAQLKETLVRLVGNINQMVDVLFNTATEINEIVSHSAKNTEKINYAIDSLSKSAMQQAVSMESASGNISRMDESIGETIDIVGELGKCAVTINDTSQSAIDVLNQLDRDNGAVIKNIQNVYEQTNATHEYVEKIQAVMEMIREIAEATNLLALNATIEAARAGEAGRGFAIVAEQVKKLATESSESTVQIEEIMGHLSANSTNAVRLMGQVKVTVQDQNKQIVDALARYGAVSDSINNITHEVKEVSELSQKINQFSEGIVHTIADLSSLSEENAQSTNVTSMESSDLAASMSGMEGKAVSLRRMAEELRSAVKIFKL